MAVTVVVVTVPIAVPAAIPVPVPATVIVIVAIGVVVTIVTPAPPVIVAPPAAMVVVIMATPVTAVIVGTVAVMVILADDFRTGGSRLGKTESDRSREEGEEQFHGRMSGWFGLRAAAVAAVRGRNARPAKPIHSRKARISGIVHGSPWTHFASVIYKLCPKPGKLHSPPNWQNFSAPVRVADGDLLPLIATFRHKNHATRNSASSPWSAAVCITRPPSTAAGRARGDK